MKRRAYFILLSVVAFFCLSFNAVDAGINDGLIAYYPLDGNADDVSGNGHHGIENGGINYVPAAVGLGAEFDGIDDFIQSIDSVTSYSGNDRTVSVWVKLYSTGQGKGILHMSHYNPYTYTAIGTLYNHSLSLDQASVFRFDNGRKETSVSVTYPNTITLYNFFHLVGVVENHLLKLYVNASPDLAHQTIFGSGGQATVTDPIVIGKYVHPNAVNPFFHGIIDDMRIYDRALTQAEVSELYHQGINHPPILDSIGNKTGQEGQLLEFQISATDPDPGDILTFSANNLPPGATFDQNIATFSWTPTYDQAGNYENVEFTVMDNGNPIELDTELITITIGNVNRAPIFAPIGVQAVDEGELLEFAVEAVDPDGDNVTLSESNMPPGAAFNAATGLFSWTPDYLQDGTYTVTFTATDDGDPIESSEMGLPITVGNTPNPTQLTDDLIDDIENSGLPHNVINSYLANLKKVNTFIEKGKIKPAVNQLFAFMCKVEEDLVTGEIDQVTGDDYLFRATEIVEDIGADPASRVCE